MSKVNFEDRITFLNNTDEDAGTDSDNEVSELGHDQAKVRDEENLGRDDAGDPHRRYPHDDVHHPDNMTCSGEYIVEGYLFSHSNAPRLCFR